MSASQRVGVLVVRVWPEHEGPSGLRARISWVDDLEQGAEQITVAAGPEDVLAVVRRWLDSFAADTTT